MSLILSVFEATATNILQTKKREWTFSREVFETNTVYFDTYTHHYQIVPFFQLEVLVEDGAGETARQTLILPVNRNLNVPEFLTPRIYNISIEETRQLALPIVTVSGRDLDQVRKCALFKHLCRLSMSVGKKRQGKGDVAKKWWHKLLTTLMVFKPFSNLSLSES